MAAGALDTSFGAGGKFTLRVGLDQSPAYMLFAKDVAVQPDGKTVVAAKFDEVHGFGDFASDFALVRLNFDGTLDKTFGPKSHPGIVQLHLGKDGGRAAVTSVAIQSDGRIVVAGGAIRERTLRGDPLEMVVARFLRNGELDNSFAGDGARFVEIGGSVASDIALQQDGKIVLGGSNFADEDFVVVRLNRNGGLDNTFGSGGIKSIGIKDDDQGRGLAIDEAGTPATNRNFGKIVLVGKSGPFKDDLISLTRLNTNGSLDKTFGSGGTVRTRLPGIDESLAKDVVIQADSKIVVYAEIDLNPAEGFIGRQAALIRYLSNGTLDGTFGGAGTGFVQEKRGGFHVPAEIVRSSSGGFITGALTDGKFTLTAYTPNGVVDTKFGNAGQVITDFGADGTANEGGIARGPGNRIVMVGGDVLKTARYLDQDANVVSIIPSDGIATEASPDKGVFTITRSEQLPIATRVFLNFSGSAINNLDYTTNLGRVLQLPPIIGIATGQVIPAAPAPGQAFIDIPAGARSVTVNVTAKADANLEGLEIATFTIAPNAAYTVGPRGRTDVAINDKTAVFVNFQAPGPVPTSPLTYVADVGQVFGNRGNGLTYGWDADNTVNVRTRNNPASPDARFDSLALMQKDGANRTWEIAVPNGMYSVQLDVGDPSFTDSIYRLNLENQLAIVGTPSGQTRWFERSFNVLVTDGRLTVSNAAGAVNNKIAFMHITPAGSGAVQGPTSAIGATNLVPPAQAKPARPRIGARIFSQVLI